MAQHPTSQNLPRHKMTRFIKEKYQSLVAFSSAEVKSASGLVVACGTGHGLQRPAIRVE